MLAASNIERTLLTLPCRRSPDAGVNQRDPNNIIIWDIKTGAKKGGYLPPMSGERWPVFKWSADDKHFCRRSDKGLSLYSTTVRWVLWCWVQIDAVDLDWG